MNFWKKLFGGSSKPTFAALVTSQPSPSPSTATSTLIPAKKSARPAGDKSVVADVKDILRNAEGARDFVARAKIAGFRIDKEDFIGLYLKKGDCNLILAVLPSRGPDSIWCLSMKADKNSETINLVDEGKFAF